MILWASEAEVLERKRLAGLHYGILVFADHSFRKDFTALIVLCLARKSSFKHGAFSHIFAHFYFILHISRSLETLDQGYFQNLEYFV